MPNSGPNGEWFETTPEFWLRVTKPIVAIQIWYSGCSVWTSRPDDWTRAPSTGVQVLTVHHGDGTRTLVKGRDAYTLPGQEGKKLGLMIDLDEFHRIYRVAMDDMWRPDP